MNVFDLQAKIGINTTEYKKGLTDASKEWSEFGGKVKDGAAKLAKISTAALGAAAAGVGALVKQSVGAYAEYEQLVGGIETLFGSNAEKVLKNSEKAFATAGMSVNEYMETSIQGAAALINSLGGDTSKAAELMDVSIQDMSDNVNKMGTSMESIQNAYRGFSRQNFTMLDNLSLGFAGTKEGMQQLLDKAKEISGVDYNIESYADIVQAIHVVQTEMGITGTTAKEAAGTITGSMSAVKAAWQNLTVEMAKPDGDVSAAFKILGDNVGAVAENMIPRIEQAIGGVGDLIAAAAPQVTEGLKKLLPKVLPSLMKTAGTLVTSVSTAVIKSAPELLTATSSMMKELFNSFADSDLGVFDWLREDAVRVVKSVKDTFKNIDFETLKNAFATLGTSFNNAFSKIGDGVAWATENIISPLIEWGANDVLPHVFDALAASIDICTEALEFIKPAASWLWDNFLEPLAGDAGDVISGSLDLIAKGLGAIADEFGGVEWEGFWKDINDGEFFANWERGWKEIKDGLADNADAIDEWFNEGEFGAGWNAFWQDLGENVYDQQEALKNFFTITGHYLREFIDLWNTGKKEITDAIDSITSRVKEFQDMWGVGAESIDDSLSNSKSVGGLAYNFLKGKLPFFGNGGRVTEPTLAVVGEKEPETIVPDSKRSQFGGGIHIDKVDIYVDGTSNDGYTIAEQISQALADLSVRQQRALGGVGW